MRDGVRLAIDFYLPTTPGPFPTVLRATPYWRTPRIPLPHLKDQPLDKHFLTSFLKAGYAVVMVDIRGTGASFGSWKGMWLDQEVQDLGEVIDWISQREWSNGKVGTIGISYEANLAWLAAATGRTALRAVVARFPDFDAYADIFFPGGIFNEKLIKAWADMTSVLNCAISQEELKAAGSPELAELVRGGPPPVDADSSKELLEKALEDHAIGVNIFDEESMRTHRDDPGGERNRVLEEVSPAGRKAEIEASHVPLLIFASWLDAATAAGALRSFVTLDNPHRVVIGPWGHGGLQGSNPLQRGMTLEPAFDRQFDEVVRFFDWHLKSDAEVEAERGIRYFTFGEERWHETTTWPPAGIESLTLFLGPFFSLLEDPPSDSDGQDEYEVDFDADAGETTRWHTQLTTAEVFYPDREKADDRLLTYTSAPLERDVVVTGFPEVTLYVRSTEADAAFYAYLERVDAEGRVIYLTDGQLRAIHRKKTPEGELNGFGPSHSFLRKDSEPLVPGTVSEIPLSLLPTSVLLLKGERIRVAIAGHDEGSFPRIPSSGFPTVTVERNSDFPSRIVLPVSYPR